MKMSQRTKQSGFTLIEVSLAIVIGVIVLAGAITLYNQSKISAGNSKAQEKVLALATVAEEIAANNGGTYPSVNTLASAWTTRRTEDYQASPWGGTAASVILALPGSNGSTAYSWTGASPASITAAWTGTSPASAGVMVYSTAAAGAGKATLWDSNTAATKSFANFVVGIIPPAGNGPAFMQGGK